MKELEYPFDSKFILQNYRKIKKRLLGEADGFIEKRIAILGGSTTANIKSCIELFLLNYGIKPVFYESEYNQYYEDAVFSNPKLEKFEPEIVYIHTTNRNIMTFPLLSDSPNTVEGFIRNQYQKFFNVWQNISKRFCCPIIQNNFEMPLYRLMGNKDASDIHGGGKFSDSPES